MRHGVTSWTDRIVYDELGTRVVPPQWLRHAYGEFEAVVSRKGYPCHFGQVAVRAGDVYVAYCSRNDLGRLPGAMRRFTRIALEQSKRRMNLALFIEPDDPPPTHEAYAETCWEILQYLHDVDDDTPEARLDPDNPRWEFCFAGMLYFVVGMSPTYLRRQSRNVGSTISMMFQPRSVFEEKFGHGVSEQARAEVRARLKKWDAIAVHPDLGVYGDRDNREWKQYVLPDDNEPVVGRCPLHVRKNLKHGADASDAEESADMNRISAASDSGVVLSVGESFAQRIDEFIARSPFFQGWRRDLVSRPAAVDFLTAFDQLVASFPGLIAAGISRLGEGGRVVLAKNLFEECGEGDRTKTHHAIYRRYLGSIDVSWSPPAEHGPTAHWRASLLERTLRGDAGEIVGLIAAGEFLAQPALTRIYDVLKPMFPAADVEYFTRHLELETEHVREIEELIGIGCAEGATLDSVERGFAFALDRWGEWFTSVAADVGLDGAGSESPEAPLAAAG